jgi:hypothetical protein
MNAITASQTGLTAVISRLQQQKEELSITYNAAITKGEKLNEVKTLYLNLKDIDKKLNDLLRITL